MIYVIKTHFVHSIRVVNEVFMIFIMTMWFMISCRNIYAHNVFIWNHARAKTSLTLAKNNIINSFL